MAECDHSAKTQENIRFPDMRVTTRLGGRPNYCESLDIPVYYEIHPENPPAALRTAENVNGFLREAYVLQCFW